MPLSVTSFLCYSIQNKCLCCTPKFTLFISTFLAYISLLHTCISLVLWLWNKGIFIKLLQVTSDVYFINGYSQSIFRAEDRFAVLQRFGVQRFTSPTRRVIFRYSFAKISLITYSQIQVRLKSQFFKEGIRMCEFSRRNMVKKCAESAVFTR